MTACSASVLLWSTQERCPSYLRPTQKRQRDAVQHANNMRMWSRCEIMATSSMISTILMVPQFPWACSIYEGGSMIKPNYQVKAAWRKDKFLLINVRHCYAFKISNTTRYTQPRSNTDEHSWQDEWRVSLRGKRYCLIASKNKKCENRDYAQAS